MYPRKEKAITSNTSHKRSTKYTEASETVCDMITAPNAYKLPNMDEKQITSLLALGSDVLKKYLSSKFAAKASAHSAQLINKGPVNPKCNSDIESPKLKSITPKTSRHAANQLVNVCFFPSVMTEKPITGKIFPDLKTVLVA